MSFKSSEQIVKSNLQRIISGSEKESQETTSGIVDENVRSDLVQMS